MSPFEELLRSSIGLDAASIGRSAVDRAVQERARICGLPAGEYGGYLRSSDIELQALIDTVVVPETWFFRDQASFELLAQLAREEWLPRAAATMRLLSLPSSTGEEPYSMAMTLLDAGLAPGRFTIEAIDVSEMSLERASRAIYGRNSFRGESLGFRDRYFDVYPGGHRLHGRIREQVRFRRGNICQPESIGAAGAYDVIFCRNLLIYFDRPTQERAIDLLERLLMPDGLLVVAPAETSLLLARPAQWDKAGGFGFRRRPSATRRTARVLPMPPRAPFVTPAPIAPIAPAKVAPIAASAEASLESAARLADAGRFADALTACERHRVVHGPSAEVFQLLGVLYDATGDSAEAISCYRKSLYLDPSNEEVLAHLALLLDTVGSKAEALIVRARHKRLASRDPERSPLRGAGRPASSGADR
jgi:chemotaxis protein methyltransferase WspC